MEECVAVLETVPSVRESEDAVPYQHVNGEIEFGELWCIDVAVLSAWPGLPDNVVFGYGDGKAVLDGFNLKIPAGATVALVGPSGRG